MIIAMKYNLMKDYTESAAGNYEAIIADDHYDGPCRVIITVHKNLGCCW